MSMAGAFTAIANDPSALYFNPGGLTDVHGTQFMAGATFIMPSTTFRGPAPSIDETKMESQLFTPINFYATHQLNDEFTVGVSVNNPYGLGTKWASDWVGKFVTTETSVQMFFITPTVAYKINDQISVGAGFEYALASVTLKRKTPVDPFAGEGDVTLDGTGNGVGFTFGALYKPMKDLSVGASLRSQVKVDFSGTATTTGPQQLIDAKKLPNGDVTTSLTTPMNITVGAAYHVTPELLVSADYQWVGWSSFDSLKVDFTDAAFTDLANPRLYKDTYILRFGAEYKIDAALTVRGGILSDRNPIPTPYLDPLLPDANRLGFNLGVGYKIDNNLSVDLSYLFLRFDERNTKGASKVTSTGSNAFNGVYNSTANLIGINLTYQL